MPWNPETYNQFKEIRFKPFFDLINLISDKNLKDCVDVGCGTGEQTAILADKFANAHFLGIDSSAEMLTESTKFEQERLRYELSSIEAFADADTKWDLIFSNAALQWSDHHTELFPKLITKLNSDGQFAVQMPCQKENILNIMLLEMVTEKPFCDWLNGFVRPSPLLTIDEYAQLMFDNGLEDIDISLKVYPIFAKSETDLFNFISGSALIPYMEKLDAQDQNSFRFEFLKRIRSHFGNFPAIYAFKRILLYGRKI